MQIHNSSTCYSNVLAIRSLRTECGCMVVLWSKNQMWMYSHVVVEGGSVVSEPSSCVVVEGGV